MSTWYRKLAKMEESLIPAYSVRELSDYLYEHFDRDVSEAFERNKISGSSFLKLSESQLGRMLEAIGDIVELQSLQCRVHAQVIIFLFCFVVCMSGFLL